MLRGTHPPAQNLMNMNQPSFLPQGPSQPGQSSQPQGHMLLGGNPAPPMGLLGGGAQHSVNGPNHAMFALGVPPVNPGQQTQARRILQSGHPNPGMNTGMGPNPPHLNGLGSGMGFQAGMMQSNPMARGQPQPPMMNAGGGHLGGMHSGQPMNGMTPGGMSLNPMRPPLRQMQPSMMQASHPMAPQQHRIPSGGGLQQDAQLLARQQAGAFPPHIQRPASQSQSMPGVPQPPSLPQQHAGNMQQPFTHPMTPHQQHQPPSQIRASPHPPHPNAGQGLPGGLLNTNPMQQGGPGPRAHMTPEQQQQLMGLGFSGPQMPPGMPRMPMNGQFSVGSSATPPNMGDLQSSMQPGAIGPQQRSNSRQAVMTPVQALAFNESFGSNPGMPPSHAPPRPPSQQQRLPPGYQQPQPGHQGQQLPPQHSQQPAHPHLPQQPQQQSPIGAHRSPQQQQDLLARGQPRPQSQPQMSQGQSPQQQAGPSRTPRMAQQPLPPTMVPRTPSMNGQTSQTPSIPSKPPTPAIGQQVPINARPPQGAPAVTSGPAPLNAAPAPGPPAPPQENGPPPAHSSAPATIPPRVVHVPTPMPLVGQGQGIQRLLQLSAILAGEVPSKEKHMKHILSLVWWEQIIREYFQPNAILKLTLWKDNQRTEAKPFDITTPILPRFFLSTTQSGVKSMSIQMNGARERIVPGSTNMCIVEGPASSWAFTYYNGYTVILRGTLFAQLSYHAIQNPVEGAPKYTIKIDHLSFDANTHEKLIAIEAISGQRMSPSPSLGAMHLGGTEEERKLDEPRYSIEHASMPQEPVNAFGIPQATMRCLELAESVAQMSDLIQYSRSEKLGPRDALSQFAQILREKQGATAGGSGMQGNSPRSGGFGGHNGMFESGMAMGSSPSSSLYPGPSQVPHPPPSQPQQQPDGSVHGTPKQANAAPTPQASGSTPTASASTPAATTPAAASMTPVQAHASLKRKLPPTAADTASPTTAHPEPQAKRPTRKRGRTQNGA